VLPKHNQLGREQVVETHWCFMEFQLGDWVTTTDGQIGKVSHISDMAVFVAFPNEGMPDSIGAFLASQLTKIDRAVAQENNT